MHNCVKTLRSAIRGACAQRDVERREVKNDHSTETCCGNEAGSYLRLRDSCITQPKAQGPSRTCNESEEPEEREVRGRVLSDCTPVYLHSCQALQQCGACASKISCVREGGVL